MKYQFWIIGLLILLVGCEPDKSCRQSIYVACRVVLQGTEIDSLGEPVAFHEWDSVTVQGVGNDSVLYDNQYSVNRLLLPLKTDTTITAYSILWHDEYDTLYVRHTNTLNFISMACGCAIYHTIDSTWTNSARIDSLVVINSAIEAVEQDNIRVYVTLED